MPCIIPARESLRHLISRQGPTSFQIRARPSTGSESFGSSSIFATIGVLRKGPRHTAAHATPHAAPRLNTSREALGQRKSRRVEGREGAAAHQPPQQRHLLRLPDHHQPPVDVRRHRHALHRELERPRALRIDEGALPLCNAVCGICRDSPCEREWGRENGGRPSSKPASAAPGLMSGLAVGLGRSSGPGRPQERQWPESA
jgi:hypothetical protein